MQRQWPLARGLITSKRARACVKTLVGFSHSRIFVVWLYLRHEACIFLHILTFDRLGVQLNQAPHFGWTQSLSEPSYLQSKPDIGGCVRLVSGFLKPFRLASTNGLRGLFSTCRWSCRSFTIVIGHWLVDKICLSHNMEDAYLDISTAGWEVSTKSQ